MGVHSIIYFNTDFLVLTRTPLLCLAAGLRTLFIENIYFIQTDFKQLRVLQEKGLLPLNVLLFFLEMCQTCSNGYKNIFTTSTCRNMEELNEENLFKKTTTEVSQYYDFATTSSNYAGYLQSKLIYLLS